MDEPRYKIVFDGTLMPQTPLETAKENLARLFKSDLARIEALFSGQLVVLKRDLSEGEADKYLQALHNAGAQARKESDLVSSLSLVETEDHPGAKTQAAEQAASAERMTCPKCGHEQAKASECSACGIIIDKYLARQAELSASQPIAAAPAATAGSSSGNAAQSPYATPQAPVGEALPEYGELQYFTVQGRIGRVRYLGWSMGMILAMIPLFILFAALTAASQTLGALVLIAACVGMVVVSIFFGVQRLHDIGWSGWLWLLNFVPVVGSVMALLMLLVPGSVGANRYGPPPPPNSRGVTGLAWASILVPVVGILAAIAIPAYQGYLTRAQEAAYSQDQSYDPAATAEPQAYDDEDAAAVETDEPSEQ